MKRKRILGLDVGKKRTGLAQSDPMLTIASPIGAFGTPDIFRKIEEIASESDILRIVVGWPVHLSGDSGESVHMVKSFMGELKKRFPEIETDVLDERFTSSLAQQSIIDAGTKKKKRQEKGLVDAVAAAILLQNYLDKRSYKA
jgi:putative Holliday junction resolvase